MLGIYPVISSHFRCRLYRRIIAAGLCIPHDPAEHEPYARERYAVAPHLIFRTVGIRIFQPLCDLLVGLHLAAGHFGVGLEHLVPEVHFLIGRFFRTEVGTPVVREALESGALGGRQTADGVSALDSARPFCHQRRLKLLFKGRSELSVLPLVEGKNNRLLSVIKAFSELDLNPRTIDNVKMGYIFEELIRKFSENAEAGDHYTGRDIIKLMVNILLAEGCDDIFDDGKVITILDQACGTGGMLSTGYNFIKRYNPSADVRLFGQEINPESYAMCLAEMLIKGQNAENICYQDTMKADRFKSTKMRFVLENPPFGTAWGGKDAAEGVEDAVNAEYQKGFDGRWGAGLPGSGDMQMLFLQSAIDKMDDNFGRAAIIENGSPLFSGGTASGESQIRRWMLENDLIEAIIALPTDLFYNTGIATYIWVLSKNKRPERKGKIQLIDASTFFKKLRKALGDKKNEISPEDRSAVTQLYADFAENEYCKIYDNEEFIYREYTVMQPLQRSYAITEERMEAMLSKGALSSLYDQAKADELENAEELTGKDQKKLEAYQNNQPVYEAIVSALKASVSEQVYNTPAAFLPVLTKALSSVTADKKLIEKIADGLSVMDKNAEIQRDRKGNIIYDKETKDTELVKWEESIEDYMAREVLPHIPDAAAFFEEDLGKKKPVIKTGAEIPFTRYFYKYQPSTPSEELETRFKELELSVTERVAKLFE